MVKEEACILQACCCTFMIKQGVVKEQESKRSPSARRRWVNSLDGGDCVIFKGGGEFKSKDPKFERLGQGELQSNSIVLI